MSIRQNNGGNELKATGNFTAANKGRKADSCRARKITPENKMIEDEL